MDLSISGYGPIHFQQGRAPFYQGSLLPGSRHIYTQEDFGNIFIQEMTTDYYSIRHSYFQFHDKVKLEGHTIGDGLYSRVMHRNDLTHQIKGAAAFKLREKECTLLRAKSVSGHIICPPHDEIETFDCWFSEKLLQKMTPHFPQVIKMYNALSEKNKLHLAHNGIPIPPDTKKIIYEMLYYHHPLHVLRYYFDLKICEYLLSLLLHTFRTPLKKQIPDAHIDAAHKARLYIIEHPGIKHTTKGLSKIVQLNESYLKKAFMHVFHVAIYKFQKNGKLEKAMKLLIETDMPLKEIASKVGYSHHNHLSYNFRLRYGMTMGEYRKMHRPIH